MGVAEEWEEMEEYAMQMEQMKRQVSSLTDVLSKLQTSDNSVDSGASKPKATVDCTAEGCDRPIDWYCTVCKAFICTKCSKKPCDKKDNHELVDFDEIYETCKSKYVEWKGGKQSTLASLTKQQKKLEGEIARQLQMMAGASPQSLADPELSKILAELPAKQKLLRDVTKQVEEAESSLDANGVNVESLSQTEFVQVFDELDFSSSLFEETDIHQIAMYSGCEVISKKTCYDLDDTPSGEVLLGGNRGFDVCSKEGNITRSVTSQEGDFTSIQYYKGKIFTLLKEPQGSDKRRIVVYSASDYKEVTRWELSNFTYVSMMAVSNDKVYTVDAATQSIQIYTTQGSFISSFTNSAFRKPVYMSSCHPDGILLADWSAGIVYKMECSTDKIAWQFEVNGPRGVHCDRQGNVWVWSSPEKAFYVRSADGKEMRKFNHPEVVNLGTEHITGLLLADNKLWGAACGKGVLRIKVELS